MSISKIDFANFHDEVISSEKNCVVYFRNEGCHLCANLSPIYDKLASLYDNIKFFYVDTAEDELLTSVYSDDGVPTIYFFSSGKATEIPYPGNEFSGYSEESMVDFSKAHP